MYQLHGGVYVVRRRMGAVLPGGAGNYFNTPDIVGNSITGDIDIRVKARLTDWTPAAANTLIAKDGESAGARAWYFIVGAPTGVLQFVYSNDGTATRTATSSAATGITDGAIKWVRATYVTSTGKVNFYMSDDAVTWTAIGTEQTLTSGAIADTGNAVTVGAKGGAGNTAPTTGTIYRAQVYAGISGALAVDFNPNNYVTGTTFVSAITGETWTVSGTASVARSL